ncbi:hypothetical protein [Dapis sp. BLCC M229]
MKPNNSNSKDLSSKFQELSSCQKLSDIGTLAKNMLKIVSNPYTI